MYIAELIKEEMENLPDAAWIDAMYKKGMITFTEAKQMLLSAYNDRGKAFVIEYKAGTRYKALSDTIYYSRREAENSIPNDPTRKYRLKAITAGEITTLSARRKGNE